MPAVVHLYYTFFSAPLQPERFLYYCNMLPPGEQERIKRYKRWQDAHASLIGRVLLFRALQEMHIPRAELQYTAYNKPFLNAPLEFNISHSGGYVVCAISETTKVGIDIEEIKTVDLADFSNVLSEQEYSIIQHSQNKPLEFFKTWTRKEAIIKAEGSGLGLELGSIDTSNEVVPLNGINLYLQCIDISEAYVLHLCTDKVAYVIVKQVHVD